MRTGLLGSLDAPQDGRPPIVIHFFGLWGQMCLLVENPVFLSVMRWDEYRRAVTEYATILTRHAYSIISLYLQICAYALRRSSPSILSGTELKPVLNAFIRNRGPSTHPVAIPATDIGTTLLQREETEGFQERKAGDQHPQISDHSVTCLNFV